MTDAEIEILLNEMTVTDSEMVALQEAASVLYNRHGIRPMEDTPSSRALEKCLAVLQSPASPFNKIADPKTFMEDVLHMVKGRIKSCGKCGICSACAVGVHLGLVKDPLARTQEENSSMGEGRDNGALLP